MTEEPRPGPTAGAMRLIFEYDGDEVRLVSSQRIDMALTGFQTPAEQRLGHFAEVRDAADRSLAMVPVTGLRSGTEVFPENPGDPIIRITPEHPHGAFTVVVPAPSAAAAVSLVEITAPAQRGLEPGIPPAPGRKVLGTYPIRQEGEER